VNVLVLILERLLTQMEKRAILSTKTFYRPEDIRVNEVITLFGSRFVGKKQREPIGKMASPGKWWEQMTP
jgi:hypothetical protein